MHLWADFPFLRFWATLCPAGARELETVWLVTDKPKDENIPILSEIKPRETQARCGRVAEIYACFLRGS